MDYCNYKTVNNKNAKETVLEIIQEMYLVDLFRDLHPSLKHILREESIHSNRPDFFFLISESLLTSLNGCKIENSYRIDHSAVVLNICFNDFQKGRHFWKHNNSLLYDINYVGAIKSKIMEVKCQYALPVYNSDNLNNIPDNELQFTINDQLFLDTLLMELRGKSMPYSSHKTDIKICKLEQDLNSENIEKLQSMKTDLYELRKEKVKGAVIRSRAINIVEGENQQTIFVI